MTTNVEFRRDHKGALQMYVSGVPALGAKVTGVNMIEGELQAVLLMPLSAATIGEMNNVVPFPVAAVQASNGQTQNPKS